MRHIRRWEQGDFSAPRPLIFHGFPLSDEKPSSFLWEPIDFQAPAALHSARLYYRSGWTALIFWNADIYFIDEILTFDVMIEMLRARFDNAFYLQGSVIRDYVD